MMQASPRAAIASCGSKTAKSSANAGAVSPLHSLSAPGGGEGWGEVGDSRAMADAHLTLPRLWRGPLPLPPEGRRGVFANRFQGAVPFAEIDIDRAHQDTVLLRVADDLGRCVEPHRLAVEESAGEDFGVDALDPGRDIDEEGKARGMAFGEAIGAEPLDLVEAAGREIRGIAALRHAPDELVAEQM